MQSRGVNGAASSTVGAREGGVDVGRHAAEHVADLLRVVSVDAHAPASAAQPPVLVAAEHVRATVERAEPHRRRVDALYERVDAELGQRPTLLRTVGYQVTTRELPVPTTCRNTPAVATAHAPPHPQTN